MAIPPVVTIVGRVPFKIDEFWRRELGKFFEDRVKESSLAIVATAPGWTERDLSRQARRVLCGLLLRGMPYIQGAGIFLAG